MRSVTVGTTSTMTSPTSEILITDFRLRSVTGIFTSVRTTESFREDIQMSWYNMDKQEQLATLRRCLQDIELYQVQLPGRID